MTPDAKRRYARHLVLPEIGEGGQARLLASSALVVGAGGLGAAAIAALAAMGVGRIGIADFDRVELSNLQRQGLYETGDIGRLKVEAARDRVEELNPDARVEALPLRVGAENARALARGFDIVLDGSDNFATRFAVSDACLAERKALVSAAISGFAGQMSTFKAHEGAPHPCYRCLVPEAPPREISCAQEGILGALAGMMGHMQALEAVKELLDIGQSLSGRLIIYDALAGDFRSVVLVRDPECGACGDDSIVR